MVSIRIVKVYVEILNEHLVVRALEATGQALLALGQRERVEICVAGATAGLLAGILRAGRTTSDCDVMWVSDAGAWVRLDEAAERVRLQLDLEPGWLNGKCKVFAWKLPLGWRERAQGVGEFGPLRVVRLDRFDFIAAKIAVQPSRTRDLEDLIAARPTREELSRLHDHLDRLTAEDLNRNEFEAERALLRRLEAVL